MILGPAHACRPGRRSRKATAFSRVTAHCHRRQGDRSTRASAAGSVKLVMTRTRAADSRATAGRAARCCIPAWRQRRRTNARTRNGLPCRDDCAGGHPGEGRRRPGDRGRHDRGADAGKRRRRPRRGARPLWHEFGDLNLLLPKRRARRDLCDRADVTDGGAQPTPAAPHRLWLNAGPHGRAVRPSHWPASERAASTMARMPIPAWSMSCADVPEVGRPRTARWCRCMGSPRSARASRTAEPMPPCG